MFYCDVGVDIDVGDVFIDKIKFFVKKILCDGVFGGIGGFGVLFEVLKKYKELVFVLGIDGVGIKFKLVFYLNKYDMVG